MYFHASLPRGPLFNKVFLLIFTHLDTARITGLVVKILSKLVLQHSHTLEIPFLVLIFPVFDQKSIFKYRFKVIKQKFRFVANIIGLYQRPSRFHVACNCPLSCFMLWPGSFFSSYLCFYMSSQFQNSMGVSFISVDYPIKFS